MLARRFDPVAALGVGAALAAAAAARLYQIGAPFAYGFDGYAGAAFTIAARNFARVGFLELQFAPRIAAGPVPGESAPYLNHPPTIWYFLGVAIAALGDAEWLARLIPSLATLAATALLFAIGRRLGGARLGAAAAFAFAALPMVGIYGGIVNYEPVVLAFVLATWLGYLRWREGGRRRDLALTVGSFAAAILADWFGAFVGLPIALHALLAKPRAPRWFVPLMAGLAVALAAGLVAFAEWARPDAASGMIRAARHRAGNRRHDSTTETFTPGEWLRLHALYLDYFYRKAGLALAALGVLLGLVSGRPELRRAAGHAALLALVGVQVVVCFPQQSFQHSYLTYPFAAAVALAIGIVPVAAWRGLVGRPAALRAAALVAALAALGGFAGEAARHTYRHLAPTVNDHACRDIGLAIRAATRFEDGVATPSIDGNLWFPVTYYADRAIYLGIDSLEALEALRRAPPRPSAPVRYVVFTPEVYEQYEPFARALAARYPVAQAGKILVFDVGG